MAFLIEDKRFINENIFEFEKRMESQYTRFLDETPTFVTYYKINTTNSTTDSGLFDVERIIGSNSPLRFNKIEDFPIYGINTVLLDLSEEDEGLTINFESDGKILPNTIRPLPNDFFTISYLNKDYLFMVTSVNYDVIKSNNFYKIDFTVKSLSSERVDELNRQIDETSTCIFRNIGTQDECIIKTKDYNKIIDMNNFYKGICKRYKSLFYIDKYNSFIFKNCDDIIMYDPFMNFFIQKHELFNERFNYDTLYIDNQDFHNEYALENEYDLSIYGTIEGCITDDLPDQLLYSTKSIELDTSIFNYYGNRNIKGLTFANFVKTYHYISPYIFEKIKTNKVNYEDSIFIKILVDYFNKNITSINSINLKELKQQYNRFTFSTDNFIIIPIVLFILKNQYLSFIKKTTI